MMKILAPISSIAEVDPLIEAGADEFYCGVLPPVWKKSYTNVASPNRREWSVSNLKSYDELNCLVERAHRHSVPVFLTMNAFYSQPQFEAVLKQLELARQARVDALIVADLGLLLILQKDWEGVFEIHISTGGTTFNSETAKFYQSLGAKRVVLPRTVTMTVINTIREKVPDLDLELFILNRGCKNIDGFCTFHHGVNEILRRGSWNIPKGWHVDYYFLEVMRRLPLSLARPLARCGLFGAIGACFLNYRAELIPETEGGVEAERKRRIERKLEDNFDVLSGIDPCGAGRYEELAEAGIRSLKIIGRSNPRSKKIRDVKFLKAVEGAYEQGLRGKDLQRRVQELYRKIYGTACLNLCYYP